MKTTVLFCDFCGSKDAKTIYLTIGDQPDAAGGPSEKIQEEIEICLNCMISKIWNRIESKIPYSEQKKIFEILNDSELQFYEFHIFKPF
jgi:hypothetical protein